MSTHTDRPAIIPAQARVIRDALYLASRANIARLEECWDAMFKAMGVTVDNDNPTQRDDVQIAARKVMRDNAAFNHAEVIDAYLKLEDAGREGDQIADALATIKAYLP